MKNKLNTRPPVFPTEKLSMEDWMKELKVSSQYGENSKPLFETSTIKLSGYLHMINKMFDGNNKSKPKKTIFNRSTKLRILFGLN